MHGCSYLPGRISVVRCNSSSASTHRLHQRADEMAWILGTLEAVLPTGDGVISDRLPVPVYRQVRARRGRKVRRRAYCGSCAANRETFVGWRVHVVCRLDGVPVRVQMLPAGVHDLTPVHELAYGLPAGARRLGVAANNYSPQQLMRPASWRRRGCAWSRCAGRPCVRTPGVWTPSNCARIVIRLRRSTVNWRRWALSGLTHVPMPGLN